MMKGLLFGTAMAVIATLPLLAQTTQKATAIFINTQGQQSGMPIYCKRPRGC